MTDAIVSIENLQFLSNMKITAKTGHLPFKDTSEVLGKDNVDLSMNLISLLSKT